MIDRLEPHATFFAQIVEGSGSAVLIIDLPDDTNVGDVISWRCMQRLSALQIYLGIEVFPEPD